ncbi:hypothetical protein ONS95_012292 [Cadophora gregata]|uniref:uncharacterized protein n=1 Tax=Cadophora gregata TaxID=51156 RepID=UPI0026DB4EE5|nr:uncharacterized protein ONS95_012292 [Cadophora gregata]KAK0117981.1 hypothetical protein ONS95_012292 [Cadophora gregata]
MMRSSRALRLLQIRTRPSHAVYRAPRLQSTRNGYCTVCEATAGKDAAKSTTNPPASLADHRQLGVEQELFTTSVYSPGSPLFLPNGAKLFNRLTNFLRAQYDHFGFQEVITPTIYKKSLWEKSGHWDNYADDMYSVTGRGASGEKEGRQVGEDEEYGLKPMNCPGHCLIFASKQRSYRDLPIRYADFSPLHRNEVHGALSGLTRVRRFHQDDGHIFCRPSQIRQEISSTLEFIKMTYGVFGLGPYRLALSTRPADHFIGTVEEWDNAEAALRESLDASGQAWTVNEGDGAFYGPKIDVILKDSDGKEHQTATIQLDFQLPKRFELEYQAPAPEFEQKGESTTDHALLNVQGPVTPVLIHRAVLGSVERIMALLIEHHNGHWPFWLNPRQVMIITVNDSQAVVEYAQKYKRSIQGIGLSNRAPNGSLVMRAPDRISVDIDDSPRSVQKKIREAKQKRYSVIAVVGEKDIETGCVVVDLTGIPKAEEWMPKHPALRRAASTHTAISKKPKDGSVIRGVHKDFDMEKSVKRPLSHPNLAPEQLKSLPISAMELGKFLGDMATQHR